MNAEDEVNDIARDVSADICAVMSVAAPASFAAAGAVPDDAGPGEAGGGGESGSDGLSGRSSRTTAVHAQEKALQAAMVAHAVAKGTDDAAQSAAVQARVAEVDTRRAEELLQAVAAFAGFGSVIDSRDSTPARD